MGQAGRRGRQDDGLGRTTGQAGKGTAGSVTDMRFT